LNEFKRPGCSTVVAFLLAANAALKDGFTFQVSRLSFFNVPFDLRSSETKKILFKSQHRRQKRIPN